MPKRDPIDKKLFDLKAVPAEEEWSERQREIFFAAASLFAEKGFHATTTQEIAKRAGVAEGTIFRYFPSKRDLLMGLIVPLAGRMFRPLMMADVEKLFRDGKGRPAVDVLPEVLMNRLKLARKNLPMLRVALTESQHDPKLASLLQETIIPEIFALLERFMHERIDQGEFRDEDSWSLARMLFSLLAGYVALSAAVPDLFGGGDDTREIDRMVQLFLYGVVPREPL